ncbi:MAG: hypothetical protein U0704_06240 [Candidatus Eisenbacteria bacterium]
MSVALSCACGAAAAVAPSGRPSLRDSPGYVPLADPESASVRLGRRTNAPLVSARFAGGTASLRELGQAVCWGLQHAESDSLAKLSITDAEFRDILWREFPQSRPATGLQWEDAWKIQYARLRAGVIHARRDFGGHWYQLVSVRADSVARYRNFTLHSGVTIVAKDDTGVMHEWKWLRAVAERKGRFKIYSTED